MTPPPLPSPRGSLSEFLVELLREVPQDLAQWPSADGGALGEDLQLALYALYELHYRGFRDADESWEWHAGTDRPSGGAGGRLRGLSP